MGINFQELDIHPLDQLGSWTDLQSEHGDGQPIRIRTLGRFSVQSDHHPITRSQSRHQRPFELLQALIALGGRDVHEEILCQALWPDAEGDNDRNAFDVTLHRLRRIFDVENLLIIRNRRLTLNSSLAWVDVWEFEQIVNYCERLLIHAKEPAVLKQLEMCGEHLLNLYQGSFLEREPTRAWALTLRERLRSKLLRHMLDTGQLFETAKEWDGAIRLYRKGLEIEPLAESLYQRLIICFRDSGQIAQALTTFHQCKNVLNEYFQIAPSRKTLDLSQSLIRPAHRH